MKETFSPLVLAVKLLLSKKLSVEIGREEKNECEGNVDGVGRDVAWRLTRDCKSAKIHSEGPAWRMSFDIITLKVFVQSLDPNERFSRIFAQATQVRMRFIWRRSSTMNSKDKTSKRIHV